jgi:hypothetical protein
MQNNQDKIVHASAFRQSVVACSAIEHIVAAVADKDIHQGVSITINGR